MTELRRRIELLFHVIHARFSRQMSFVVGTPHCRSGRIVALAEGRRPPVSVSLFRQIANCRYPFWFRVRRRS